MRWREKIQQKMPPTSWNERWLIFFISSANYTHKKQIFRQLELKELCKKQNLYFYRKKQQQKKEEWEIKIEKLFKKQKTLVKRALNFEKFTRSSS